MLSFKFPQHFELLFLLVQKDLKARYKNSFLGYLWALANPFAFALVYYIAFKIIMRVEMPNYSIFLLAGMFPWVWMTNSIVQATSSYRANPFLVKKVRMNTLILPLANVAHELIHFCFALPVLLAFILFTGGEFYLSWFWQIPVMVLLQLMLVYPMALLLGIANVFAHDVEYLVGIFISLLFFLTPIVYPVSMVPEAYRGYFEYSPFAAIILNWRSVLIEGNIGLAGFAYCFGLAILLLFVAKKVHQRVSFKLAELL